MISTPIITKGSSLFGSTVDEFDKIDFD